MNEITDEGVVRLCKGAGALRMFDCGQNYVGSAGFNWIVKHFCKLETLWLSSSLTDTDNNAIDYASLLLAHVRVRQLKELFLSRAGVKQMEIHCHDGSYNQVTAITESTE